MKMSLGTHLALQCKYAAIRVIVWLALAGRSASLQSLQADKRIVLCCFHTFHSPKPIYKYLRILPGNMVRTRINGEDLMFSVPEDWGDERQRRWRRWYWGDDAIHYGIRNAAPMQRADFEKGE